MCLAAAVIRVPGNGRQIVAPTVLVSLTPVAATGGKLPLGFGGEAEVLARQGVQLADERLAVFPANLSTGRFSPLK